MSFSGNSQKSNYGDPQLPSHVPDGWAALGNENLDGEWFLKVPLRSIRVLVDEDGMGLSATEALLLLWLFAQVQPGSDRVEASLKRIRHTLACSIPTAQRAIRTLVRKGLRTVTVGTSFSTRGTVYDVGPLREAMRLARDRVEKKIQENTVIQVTERQNP